MSAQLMEVIRDPIRIAAELEPDLRAEADQAERDAEAHVLHRAGQYVVTQQAAHLYRITGRTSGLSTDVKALSEAQTLAEWAAWIDTLNARRGSRR
jgi:hypothetical protein